jgi:hypothetical protein
MKIEFFDIGGRRHVLRFKSWSALCDWLKRNYVFMSLANDARGIVKGADIWANEVERRIAKAL